MRFFLAILISFTFLQTTSAGQQNMIIPLRIVLKWFNQRGGAGLRSSTCSLTEIDSIDAILRSTLSKTVFEMKASMGLDTLPGDKPLSCNKKVCDADFHLDLHTVRHNASKNPVDSVQDELLAECTATLHGLSREHSYSASCRNALKSAICESSFKILAA
jgi:hypothetical protein